MGRLLAIDYGSKRTGLAVTDPLKIIATGLSTVETGDVLQYLIDYSKKEPIECFVIGDPKNLDNTPSEIEEEIGGFIEKLKLKFPDQPIHRVDERFTSKMAFQSILDSGIPKQKRRNKALIDETSAVIILQTYMDKISL